MSKNLDLVDYLDLFAALLLGFATLYVGYALQLPEWILFPTALLKVIFYLSFVEEVRK